MFYIVLPEDVFVRKEKSVVRKVGRCEVIRGCESESWEARRRLRRKATNAAPRSECDLLSQLTMPIPDTVTQPRAPAKETFEQIMGLLHRILHASM